MTNTINISSQFDSGNATVVSANSADDIRLEINKDNQSDFYQWFHFRLSSEAGIEHTIKIINAAGSAYADGWNDYQAVASYDRNTWFRVETVYKDGELIITHTPSESVVFYAYFTPYSFERHLDLLHRAQQSTLATVKNLGKTLDGRDFDMVVIGDENGNKKPVWIIARQHPGESMAEWFVEGTLDRLLDEDDPVSRTLLNDCVFYIVPNMNPDGSVRGHLRTNACGANLNREWLEPTMERSPEVKLVSLKMKETGVDLFLDIHGDEAIPYNFLAGSEGIPSYDDRLEALENGFKDAFLRASPDFQVVHGYPADEPGQANLSMASTWVGEEFHCLSYTLEMPFKDNNDLPDPVFGWSAERSYRLGEAILLPILESIKNINK